eukprot:347060_1
MKLPICNVFPLPESLKKYTWNFGGLSEIDEQQYIYTIIKTTWDDDTFICSIPYLEQFTQLRNCFVNMIYQSQKFLRIQLKDKYACTLYDVVRANNLFLWFFNSVIRKNKNAETRVKESMFLALGQCYYNRLNQQQKIEYANKMKNVSQRIIQRNEFVESIHAEQLEYIYKLKIQPQIAITSVFKEIMLTILVALSNKICMIIVNNSELLKKSIIKPLQTNLSFKTKNNKLTILGLGDYSFISFRCTKTTTTEQLANKWTFAEKYSKQINETRNSPITVVIILEAMDLADQSKDMPLKILEQLVQKSNILFIGVSSTALYSHIMHQVLIHNSTPSNTQKLRETAEELISNEDCEYVHQLMPKISQLLGVYQSIINDDKYKNNVCDDDFYHAICYVKYALKPRDISTKMQQSMMLIFGYLRPMIRLIPQEIAELCYNYYQQIQAFTTKHDDMILVEAILRNFGGLSLHKMKQILFPKIAEK